MPPPSLKSKKSRPKSKSRSKSKRVMVLGEVGDLPAIKVSGQRIDNYEVVGQPADAGLPAPFGVLAWSPVYDYELRSHLTPKLYIFSSESKRDDFQQDLFDDYPNLLLQAYQFTPPLRSQSAKPKSRTF